MFGHYDARPMPSAIVFDFNGTLSDDEPLMCGIFKSLFAEHGKPLTEREYYDELAGLSDPEIVRTWLGADHPALDAVIQERVDRYRAAVGDGSTVHGHVREAVRYAARQVPLAICSGAARAEIEPVIEAAGIADCFRAIVSSDDVAHGKPDPEGYLAALDALGTRDALVFEDTEAGIASAKAAGLHVIAKVGTLERERLRQADELVERIDADLIRRCLS
jgi:beta-phosphoglucomutase